MSDTVERMWAEFRVSGLPYSADASDRGYTSWSFGSDAGMADELAELVVHGAKRATAGSLWAYEQEAEPIPEIGDFSIITDGSGTARCIIRTTGVQVTPFSEVDEDFARSEGEGDLSLRYWREGHWRYFTVELEALGLRPSPHMPVVCERFEVVYPTSDSQRSQDTTEPETGS